MQSRRKGEEKRMNKKPSQKFEDAVAHLALVRAIRAQQDAWIAENAKREFSAHVQGMSNAFRQVRG
jgi:hypothetical protein